jgi:hypothetical protein
MTDINVTYNHVFMAIIFAIGAILTTVTWDIDAKIEDKNCSSTTLKTVNKLGLIIGVILMTSSISFFGCSYRCQNVLGGYNLATYIGTLCMLGIVLIILGTIISASSIDNCSNAGSPASIWGLGTIIVLSCIIYFYFTYRNLIKY